jgi:Trk K+ transport system NAD-binding subunit
LLAVDAETGESVWTTALDRVTVHTPRANTVVPSGDRVLVAGEDGVLRCLR